MNRLQSELHRLYLPRPGAESDAPSPVLVDRQGWVRALVMELILPAGWAVLGKVWHGVQAELDLPAPGIAVSGTDGLQLWFSLEEPASVRQAHDFLESLRLRFLADLAPERLRLMPASTATAASPEHHVRLVPSEQLSTGNWSAFVAPDLAPIFAETPWLDIPPGEEGQATLLRALNSITPTAFEAASARLQAMARPSVAPIGDNSAGAAHVLQAGTVASPARDEAERFLLRVMNDATVVLELRIEAAAALLRSRNRGEP